eukprot:881691-Pelagomonas_calceolata.AAC.7
MSQNVEVCQERNKVSIWKLGKTDSCHETSPAKKGPHALRTDSLTSKLAGLKTLQTHSSQARRFP